MTWRKPRGVASAGTDAEKEATGVSVAALGMVFLLFPRGGGGSLLTHSCPHPLLALFVSLNNTWGILISY